LPGAPKFSPIRSITPFGEKISSRFSKFYSLQSIVGLKWRLSDMIEAFLGWLGLWHHSFVIPVILFEGLPLIKAVRRS
jgi:hypothetical protein